MITSKLKIIVTGGAGSIGSYIAGQLVDAGASVIIIDRNADALAKALVDKHGLIGYSCDLTDYNDVTKCVHKIFTEHPDVSVLINNAGFIYSAPVINLLSVADRRHDFAAWQKVIDANLTSVFNAGVSVIDKMVRNRTKGLLINVSSISANGNPGQTAYSAAKAGVNALTVTWSKELFMLGIRVAGIAPGFFDTSSTRASVSESNIDKIVKKIPSQRLGTLQELFTSVKFIIENDYYNGKILEIDGGLVI